MMIAILLFSLAYLWLLLETDWLTINLMSAGVKQDLRELWLATFEPYCGAWRLEPLKTLVTEPEPCAENNIVATGYHIEHSLKGKAKTKNSEYEILVSPAVDDVLCGRDWLDEHWNDLVNYTPEIMLDMVGVRYNMTIKPQGISEGILDKVMKANKLSKQQKLKYA